MRAIPQLSCSSNDSPDNIRAIIRYDSSSTVIPTTTAWAQTDSCDDPDLSDLVPYLPQTVTSPTGEDLTVTVFANEENLFRWKIGTESMMVQWAEPSLMQVYDGVTTFEDQDCVYNLPNKDVWVYW